MSQAWDDHRLARGARLGWQRWAGALAAEWIDVEPEASVRGMAAGLTTLLAAAGVR